VSWHSYPPATNVNAVYALYCIFLLLWIGDQVYKSVSPNAARAREQPMVTVFSIDAGSSREGFTSCPSVSVSHRE
jgi:hypothetical protein